MTALQCSLGRQLPRVRPTGSAYRSARPASFITTTKASRLCNARARKVHSLPTRTPEPVFWSTARPAVGLPRPRTATTPFYSTQAPAPSKQPIVHDIFEPVTGTWQYVVADPATANAVIIDPVLDYDPATQAIMTKSADELLAFVQEKGYRVCHILETHAHADHITAASYLQSQLAKKQGHAKPPPIGIGRRIANVQALFGERYGVPSTERGGVFTKLFDDDEQFSIGGLQATALHLPGHTPDHLGYMIGDNVFCGDSIFMADIGTARCDFPGGSARDLYQSGRRLLSLPGHVKIWTGHDYPPVEERREPAACLTVDEHRARNKHLADGISEEQYVAMRTARDRTMAAPRLLHQSLQVNIRGGRMPRPTQAGLRLLHLPLKGGEW